MSTEINVSVYYLSGETFTIIINQNTLIWELKQVIATTRNLHDYILYLFIANTENELQNKKSLSSFNIVDKLNLFILFKKYKLEWITLGYNCSTNINKSIVTAYKTTSDHLITTQVELFYGCHYCEMVITNLGTMCDILFGVVKPGLSPNNNWNNIIQCGYFISMKTGGLNSKNMRHSNSCGKLCNGDRIGILLNYNTQTLTFYRNYTKIGPGFTNVHTKPLMFGTVMYHGVSQYFGNACVSITNNLNLPFIESC